MGLLLRASPYHGARRRSYIPLETAAKVKTSESKTIEWFTCVEGLSRQFPPFIRLVALETFQF